MPPDMLALLGTAASVGLLHTLLGPDHYLPFIVMSKARGWSLPKTARITALCGVGHVLGSIILGAVGVAAGLTLDRLTATDTLRSGIAAWLLIGFGVAYMAWGLRRAARNRPHTHPHVHPGGIVHDHQHTHQTQHVHVHDPTADPAPSRNLTPWILFTIFIFGPCEPLIPTLMYPAAQGDAWGVVAVASLFAVVTITTMTALVLIGASGVRWVPLAGLQRYSHALAGAIVCLCGVAIQWWGW